MTERSSAKEYLVDATPQWRGSLSGRCFNHLLVAAIPPVVFLVYPLLNCMDNDIFAAQSPAGAIAQQSRCPSHHTL